MKRTHQQSNGRRSESRSGEFPPEVEQALQEAAREAAGKRLDMSEGSPLGKLIGRFTELALQQEMHEHLGYARGERSIDEQTGEPQGRANTRNGYNRKTLKSTHGSTEIAVPRDRNGSFEPVILPKYARVSDDVADRVVAMYATGMTTRDIAEHIRELYHFEATDDFVSGLVAKLDPELKAWRNRPLEPIYACVYADAVHVNVRHDSGIKATAFYIISGYGESGTHDVLGIWCDDNADGAGSHAESATFWYRALNELRSRGVQDVFVIATDDLTGIQNVVATVFPAAQHVPCVVHLVRNALKHVAWDKRKEVATALRAIYTASTFEAAELALEQFGQQYEHRYPAIVKQWNAAMPRLSALWGFSKEVRKMIYTTNPQENINRQLRKVTKNRSVLPNTASGVRLLTLVLIRIDRRNQRRIRPDWKRIVGELHILYHDRLPNDWGYRLMN